MSLEKLKKFTLRTLIWGGVFTFSLWVGKLCDDHNKITGFRDENEILAKKVNAFWELEKTKIDLINKTAEDYCHYYKIQAGAPLPPNTFYEEKNNLWKHFNKKNSLQVVSQIKIENKNCKIQPACLITINNKAPQKDQHYAYIGILWPQAIMGSSYDFYPKDNYAVKTLINANKIIEKQKGHSTKHTN